MTAGRLAAFELTQLARNVAAGARLAFFLPVRAHAFRVSAVQYVLLVSFNGALWIAAAGLRAGFAGSPDFSALPAYCAAVVLVLLSALVVAHLYGMPGQLLLFAVALSASDPVFEAAGLLLPALAAALGRPDVVLYGYMLWSWAVSVRAVLLCGGRRRPQGWRAAAAVTLISAAAFLFLPRAEPWVQPLEDEAPLPALTDERVFHRQGELIEEALAAIEPGGPGPELYFVGFAPDASMDVFLREMRFVRNLFEERFGAAGRSIALVSSEAALEELPIGSTTNLARALEAAGEAMNADEDVLFLFLSAHGDPEHRLSASQPPLQLASLTPTALARMLQESGVKWRVIVVSACFAGGFIEPLRDANTIVIAASAADRNSFGCEHGRDFTYFGEAFFKEALAQTRSFAGAFDIARGLVAKKEAAEGLTPSLPQIWVGEAIAAQLKKLAH
ncbi:MAG TPA: C13 family peptidase [Burkholderiales bacterium]|nr:C13 family peptidase [Burkholderiales bacterium]